MENKIEQIPNAIINTIIDGIWKSIFTQTVDKEGRQHFILEKFENEQLIERIEKII